MAHPSKSGEVKDSNSQSPPADEGYYGPSLRVSDTRASYKSPPPPFELNRSGLTCFVHFRSGIEGPRELAEVLALPDKRRAAEEPNGRGNQQKKTKASKENQASSWSSSHEQGGPSHSGATEMVRRPVVLSLTKEKCAAKMKRFQKAQEEYEERRRRRVEEERERERVQRAWDLDEGVGDNE